MVEAFAVHPLPSVTKTLTVPAGKLPMLCEIEAGTDKLISAPPVSIDTL
jgi:hypothetical protein